MSGMFQISQALVDKRGGCSITKSSGGGDNEDFLSNTLASLLGPDLAMYLLARIRLFSGFGIKSNPERERSAKSRRL